MSASHANQSERKVILTDGTPGIVRPLIPEDKWALTTALEELAEDSREKRFFYNKAQFSEKELERLSNPDGKNHLAFGLAVDLEDEEEMLPVAVARYFRDPKNKEVAELAIVTADFWQGRGAVKELMCSLTAAALEVGIRYWFASMFADNFRMKRLLDHFSNRLHEREVGSNVVEGIYEIVEPAGQFFDKESMLQLTKESGL